MRELTNIRETARLLRVSKEFLYRAAERNEIPVYRFGKALRFDIEEIRAWAKGTAERGFK